MSVFKDYFVGTVKDRYAKFEGRARRSEFWYFTLFYMIIYYALLFISGLLFGGMASAVDIENIGLAALAPMALGLIFALAMFIPNLAVGVRRLHDFNCISTTNWIYRTTCILVYRQ